MTGQELRTLRLHYGLTHQAIARHTGRSMSTVFRWESSEGRIAWTDVLKLRLLFMRLAQRGKR